jgi:LemA protein
MSAVVLVVLVGGVIAAAGLLSLSVGVYNGLVQVRNNVEKAFQNIDVILKQRHDELPKLVDACRAYMKHERDVLEALTRLREHYEKSDSIDEKIALENEINKKLSTITGRWEQYPELKASQNFLQIQGRVSELETKIADRREFFNDSVNIYNIQIERFPDMLLARVLAYQRHAFLAVPQEDTRDVEMQFG